MQKTTLLLVRHADQVNPSGVIYGRLPGFPLSPLGRAQAEAVAAWLASHYRIKHVYTSPLLRARQTAGFIATATGAALHRSRGLLEILQRMLKACRRIVSRHPGVTVVAVSHGDPIAIVRAFVRHGAPSLKAIRGRDYPQKSSVTSLIFAGGEGALEMEFVYDPPKELRSKR